MASTDDRRYIQPDWFTAHVMNPAVRALAAWGVSLYGSRLLAVPGRKSGAVRVTVVNPLEVGGQRYLVAPRGVTQWVLNLRHGGSGELRLGRKTQAFRAVELDDAEKVDILRAYLRRWRFEVGQFFQGVGADAPDEDLARIAPDYPVFRLTPV